jgi:hypothetical protein
MNAEQLKPQQVKPTEVRIVDVDIPMGSLILLIIKVAIAAIPAAVIVGVIYFFGAAFLTGILMAVFRH